MQMYPNLKAECARKNITNRMLAKCANCHENTIGNYYSDKDNSRISVEVAFKIRKTFFPELSLEYLFKN